MKKKLFLLVVLLFIVSSCDSKEEKKENQTTDNESIIYRSVKTGKENNYSFVYSDHDTCIKNGNNDHFQLIDSGIKVTVYDCEEIVNSKDEHYWGVIFYNCPDEACVFYY